MKLAEYRRKRDFTKTKEPPPKIKKPSHIPIFVVQRHDARRLHFDFRLEDEGVLKSWAVPKGIPRSSSEKRLAVMTEDHPISYAKFEGIIPAGEYGAGTVKIFDSGKFVNITIKDGKVQPLAEAIKKGHFLVYLKGDVLEGSFALTRIQDKNWIMVKMREDKQKMNYPSSIKIGKKLIEVTNGTKLLQESIPKWEFVNYHHRIASLMLPHIKDRPISMFRFPDGREGFFQKNIPDYFPSWFARKTIDKVTYSICKDEASIVYLGNQVCTIHTFTSRADKPDYPDKIIFDLDPSKKELALLKDVAVSLRKFLTKLGFTPYIMTTGGKGYHVVVPIKRDCTNEEVREFAGKISSAFVSGSPDILTTELSKAKRHNRIFVDVNRNSARQTAVAPYSVRNSFGFPIACPFDWKDLKTIDPQTYNIFSIIKKDAWKDFFKHAVSIKQIIKHLSA